jgi:hypothetical protein
MFSAHEIAGRAWYSNGARGNNESQIVLGADADLGRHRSAGRAPALQGRKQLDFIMLLLEAFEFCRTTTGRVAKLARWVYRMLRYGMKYVDRGAAFYEAEHQRFQIKHLKWTAAKLGYKVTLLPAA